MSPSGSLEEQLERLGQELGRTPNLAQSVVDRLALRTAGDSEHTLPPPNRRLRWHVASAVAATIVLSLGIWWLWQPKPLYARMLEALAQAETVHATGWTRQVDRRWPLENPSQHGEDKDDTGVKHDVDIWYWTDPDGTPRSYVRQGPVVMIRRGGDLCEYQEDTNLTYLRSGGAGRDEVKRFSELAGYLKALERPSLAKEDLGTRRESGRTLRGIRHTEGSRIEDVWIDEQLNLPVRFILTRRESREPVAELAFTINVQVPQAIADYEPPKTDKVRYGGSHKNANLAWRQHVQEIGLHFEQEPIAGRIAVLPRKDGKTFDNQWTLQTPDAKYWVMPLDHDQYERMTLRDFMQDVATQDGERRYGTWRMPREYHDVEIPRCDLVYEDGTPWQEWVQFVLNRFDLEFVDQVEDRILWIAKHDGRPLKPWQEVHPPVPYVVEGGVEKKGYVRPGIGHVLRPVSLNELFADFNQLIDRQDLSADKPWIVDETDLPKPPPYDQNGHGTRREYRENVVEKQFLVATDSPWFVGHESLQMAKDWYRKEFGITFTEVVQPVTVHVVRPKR